MAHTIYDNFYLSNEVEDQFNSHLDLQQFCTVDNSLVGTAGMKRKINVYKATKEIRKEITDVKVKVNDLSERVVMVEQSTKSAHHRLDRYEEEEIYHGKPRKRWWV